MNQNWENYKKTNFGPKFWPALPKFGPTNLFMSSASNSCYALFQITILDNIKESYGNSYEKMTKKQKFRSKFWPVLNKFGLPQIFTCVYSVLLARHCSKLPCLGNLKGIQWTKLEKKGKRPNFRSDFGLFIPNLDPFKTHAFFVSFISISS